MHRTDSSFRRHPGGGSLRRFSFRRKLTRESIPEPTSTWSFDNATHEWQLLRGNVRFRFIYIFRFITHIHLIFFMFVIAHALLTHLSTFPGHYRIRIDLLVPSEM
jgi:hypothetical protein